MTSIFQSLNRYFEPRKEYGVIFIRIIIGWRLVDGTQDNVFSWARMIEFRDFLEQHGVVYPLVAAHVSVYAQFICGILYILGFFTRAAAALMIINFIIALYIAHIGTSFQQSFDALMMLFGSVFFLFHGPGKFSVDEVAPWQKKN
ncbi:MAG TPA: DoxX family protein [Chryseosolibacter sp.]|nr:DoxX family protein [Chryseosolibacter sp.]